MHFLAGVLLNQHFQSTNEITFHLTPYLLFIPKRSLIGCSPRATRMNPRFRGSSLHIGRANGKEPYEMHNTVLLKTSKEKDLGVTISADWKVSEQCGIAARKGNQLLGMIKRNITYREKNSIIPLYKSIVRPHLEYCIQAWRPHLKKDIDKLERVQRRATKLIPELRILSYEDRVQQCKLTTLETRRVRCDQI